MKKTIKKEMMPFVTAGTSKQLKTGSWKVLTPEINNIKCIKCLRCVNFCPENTIVLNEKENKIKIDLEYCKGCGICVEECPVKAIQMKNNKKK